MKLIRPILLLVAFVLLIPAPVASAKNKRNWHLGDRTLKQGHRGHDVKILQQFLSDAGQRTSVDGEFGNATKRAVRSFERAQRQPVDGTVNETDVRVLRDVAVNGGAVASDNAPGGALPKQQPLRPAQPAQATPSRLGPGMTATVGSDGLATSPAAAPPAVQQIIAAGNEIATKPYIYGGGHGRWNDAGYDCSGSVSYALHGGGLLEQSMASGGFMTWAEPGPGQWVTIYSNAGHMYMMVAGLRFDTSGRKGAGTRWQTELRTTSGYSVRHPPGL